jgi:hypothetical protein
MTIPVKGGITHLKRSKHLAADLRCYLTEHEKSLLESQAQQAGLSLSQWSRQRLLEAAEFAPEVLKVLQKMRTARQLSQTSSAGPLALNR